MIGCVDPTGSWALGLIALAIAWYAVAKLKYGKRSGDNG